MARRATLDRLWRRYDRTRDPHDREALVAACKPLVMDIAYGMSRGLAAHYRDIDELVSFGYDGVMRAIEEGYDPRKGRSFELWTKYRIEWAIRDAHRVVRWGPRSVWERDRDVDQAYFALCNRLRRQPEPAEIATELKWSTEQYERYLADRKQVDVMSLDRLIRPEDEPGNQERTLLDIIEDRRSPNPVALAEQQELSAYFQRAMLCLTPTQRLAMHCYYREDMTQAEIGRRLGVTGSRASQILTQALHRIRANRTT